MHEALVQHAVCAEHGEVVELDGEVISAAPANGPQLRALDLVDEHEHGCGFDLVLVDEVVISPAVDATAAAAVLPEPGPMATPGTPRGPPLAYAPKTSPPSTS